MKQNKWANLWQLDPTIAYLNHGSFGAVPHTVQEVQNAFRDCAIADPNQWFRFQMPELLTAARLQVAACFGVDDNLLAFVPNASQGVITAVQALVNESASRETTAHLVATSLGYGGVLQGLQHIAKYSKCTFAIAELVYPTDISAELIADRISECITDHVRPTIVILDHITSETGLLLTVEEVISLIRDKYKNVRFVIDAAHSAGMLPQPIPVGADVWVSNMHKWLCAPQPAAVLICGSADIARLMTPLAPSWGYDLGFPQSFEWQGTSDYSAYLSTPSAIEFQNQWSWAERDEHNRSVVDGAATLLRNAWGIEEHIDPLVEAPWLRMVQLPLAEPWTKNEIDEVVKRAGIELSAECMCMTVQGKTYVRLSAHMYNEI